LCRKTPGGYINIRLPHKGVLVSPERSSDLGK
jgi:hypothetical protein